MWEKREILRYLGADRSDEVLDKMIGLAQKEIEAAAHPRHLYRLYPLAVNQGSVDLAGKRWEGKSLASHLQGCQEAYLFAFTLGLGVDALIRRYSVTEVSMVPVLQACAAAYTEICADRAQALMEEETRERGLYLRPRYSPGYGDFPLSSQRFFFDTLEISKKIGVTLTGDFLMIPFKSITAIVGISPDPSLCHVGKCMTCSAADCPFRRG